MEGRTTGWLDACRSTGDTAFVGSFLADVGGNVDQGAAYVYYRNQGGPDAWGQVAKLTAADGAGGDGFGGGVRSSGDMAIVGAHYADVGGNATRAPLTSSIGTRAAPTPGARWPS